MEMGGTALLDRQHKMDKKSVPEWEKEPGSSKRWRDIFMRQLADTIGKFY